MSGKIILYGCGNVGKEALACFGQDLVACFCDSNGALVGTQRYNKKIISIPEMEKISDDYILVISTRLDLAYEIARFLEEKEIYNFFIYETLKEKLTDAASLNEFVETYLTPEWRLRNQRDFYRAKVIKLEVQLNYLKEHLDISTMKPATGYLRRKQKQSIDFAIEFFGYIRCLDIQPFLIAGSLIGACRHKGFIPWDDDLDFGLLREDYNKLLKFCERNCVVEVYDGSWKEYSTQKHMERMDKLVSAHPNQYLLEIWVDQIQIHRGTSCIDRMAIDFFPVDYYKTGYSLKVHKDYVKMLQKEKRRIDNVKEIVAFLNEEIETNENISKEPTDHIYFGIDSVLGYLPILENAKQDWIQTSDVLPLKKTIFENTEFWTPNHMPDFLDREFPDYLKLPEDFGIITHEGYIVDYFKKHMPSVEFYLIDAFEIYHFLPLYYYFVQNGIYANFVAEDCFNNTSGSWFDHDTAITILEEIGVRYSEKSYLDCDFAITTQDAGILKNYKGKKIHLAYGFGLTEYSFCESFKTIEGFDYKLVHGDMSYQLVKSKFPDVKLVRVGYPKYIKDYKNISERVAMDDVLEKNTHMKPVLLYFPTWGEPSSILAYKTEIEKLRKKYFVVTKAHHCTFRLESEKEILCALYSISDVVLPGNYEFEKAASLGEIALCDAVSGSATEVPYVNKNIKLILLYSPVAEKNSFKNIINDLSHCSKKPEDLQAIVKLLDERDMYQNRRNEILEGIYGEFGKCQLEELAEIIKSSKK